MAGIDPIGAGQLILGGLGLAQASSQARAQQRYLNMQAKLMRQSLNYRGKIMSHADSIDPMSMIQPSMEYARKQSADALGMYMGAAGNPDGRRDGDTNAEIAKMEAYGRSLNPLMGFAAEKYSSAPVDKLNILISALNSADPGDLSQGYGNLAASYQPNFAAPIQMMADGVQKLGKKPASTVNSTQATNVGRPASGSQSPIQTRIATEMNYNTGTSAADRIQYGNSSGGR